MAEELAKEMVQEVFLSAWKNRKGLDLKGNLKAYFFAATRNKCLNYFRKNKISACPLEASSALPLSAVDIEAEIEAAELDAEIREEVRRLPRKCRMIFILRWKEGLSYKQIAKEMGLSVKTVENQIGIALGRIRKRLFGGRKPLRIGMPSKLCILLSYTVML